MGISKLENSQVSRTNSHENKKTNSGKITGTILGATLSGMHFSEVNKDGNFLKAIRTYQKKSGNVHPLAGLAFVCAMIMTPLVAIGATLDGVIDAIKDENSKKAKSQQPQKQIDVVV